MGSPYGTHAWSARALAKGLQEIGRKHHIDIRISHFGCEAQNNGDTRNHDLWDPHIYVAFWGPK